MKSATMRRVWLIGKVGHNSTRSISQSNYPQLPPVDFEPDLYKSKLGKFEIERIHNINLNPCLKPWYSKPVLITQGHKQYVWDNYKNRYLDMFGGIVTTSVGHCHPRVVEVASKQIRKLWHVSQLYLNEEVHEFANKLANHFPDPLNNVIFCNSGSEANDIAIAMARLYTGSFDIVALRNAYHGSTTSTMPLCGIGMWKFPLPVSFGFHHVTTPDPFRGRVGGRFCRDSLVQTTRECGCVDKCKATDYYIEELSTVLNTTVPKKIAGFFIEAIQGVGGVVQYPKNYVRKAYDLIKQRHGLFIVDEVQTGFGRTGSTFWEFQSQNVTPDIVTMAKGIGNGFPMAAVITTNEIAQTLTKASFFNTFGGNPLSCAIGSVILDVIDDENLQSNSLKQGRQLLTKLAELRDKYPTIVGDVRGKGLMIGVEMMVNGQPMPAPDFDSILNDCKEMGLLIGRGGSGGNVFRITPPMCITEQDVEFSLQVLKIAFDNCLKRRL